MLYQTTTTNYYYYFYFYYYYNYFFNFIFGRVGVSFFFTFPFFFFLFDFLIFFSTISYSVSPTANAYNVLSNLHDDNRGLPGCFGFSHSIFWVETRWQPTRVFIHCCSAPIFMSCPLNFVGFGSGTTYLVRNWIPGVVKVRFWTIEE